MPLYISETTIRPNPIHAQALRNHGVSVVADVMSAEELPRLREVWDYVCTETRELDPGIMLHPGGQGRCPLDLAILAHYTVSIVNSIHDPIFSESLGNF